MASAGVVLAIGSGSQSAVDSTVGAGYRDAVLGDGPVGYWRLGEASGTSAADETGANPGSYNGGVTLGVAGALQGDPNTAVRLNGSSGYVNVPNSASLQFGDTFSYEAWVKRATLGTDQRLFSKGQNGALLQLAGANNKLRFAKSGASDIAYSTKAITDTTTWHYVVVTKNGASVHIYLDGTDVTGTVTNQTIQNTTNPLNIGRDVYNAQYVNGSLDDAAVYNKALTSAQVKAHYDKAVPSVPVDTVPPLVSLTRPSVGSTVADLTPTFAGQGGNDASDALGITIRVYAGAVATGSPVATAVASRDATGAWAADATKTLAAGQYTAQAEQDDAAGNVGLSPAVTFTVATPAAQPPTDPVVLSAGDIADCYSDGDEATASILDANPGANVLTAGDSVYQNGTPDEFRDCYDPSWGRAKARTIPTVGDHEYNTPNAAGYFAYFQDQLQPFGPAADDPTRGYYSYDLGSWHVVSLNVNCGSIGGCGAGSPEETWLRGDLSSHSNACTMVMLHDPRFSSGTVHGGTPAMQALWQAMYDNGADLTIAGNEHNYERFAPQTPSGLLDVDRGITQFVVGTGGKSHYSFTGGTLAGNSEIRNDDTFGVLKLTLHATGYDWQFLPEAGHSFTDAGSRACH